MKREFNVTGICVPDMHYMVVISEKIEKIFSLVESKKYFTINRGRQFGKTTTIGMLEKRLAGEPCRTMVGNYLCISISFELASKKMFADEEGFCQEFLTAIFESLEYREPEEAGKWVDNSITDFRLLSRFISGICRNSKRKIVLIIDEADKAANNEIFVMFLSMLREKYLLRNASKDFTFHSVILAGVYDIHNLKQKMILSGKYEPGESESRENSPWNIAADFKVDMSFSAKEIETMLAEYENDWHTGMDISVIANEIRSYTSGYPYLVSRICLLIETELDRNWTLEGVREAVKLVLGENSTLFDDMAKRIEENGDLKNLLYNLTVGGKIINYNALDPVIKLGLMFCFVKEGSESRLVVHNKIFEIAVTDYFISRNVTSPGHRNVKDAMKSDIIRDGVFNMELCLRKFKNNYAEIYTDKDFKFLERDGKLIFLTYLKPLINGKGFYHFESETRDSGKMDLVIDYLKQQFIIELKRWYGDSRHEAAYEQLAGYLKSKNTDCGYLLTFDFRREATAEFAESGWITYDGKRIFDVALSVGKSPKRTRNSSRREKKNSH